MASSGYALNYKNYVLYVCSCSQKVAIDDLYFCHHCKYPRCNDCVSTVVDNSCISCPHCFEAVPQADTRNKKNKCTHCFQCPLCGSTLTSRFVVKSNEPTDQPSSDKTPDQSPDQLLSPEKRKSVATVSSPLNRASPRGLGRSSLSSSALKSPGTKLYYLSCTHCRWSTRDVGIPDKKSPLDFKERPHPGQEKFTELMSYYKSLDLQDRSIKEQLKKQASRKLRNYSGLLDTSKFKRDLSPKHTATLDKTMSIAEDPDPLPEEYYSSPVAMDTITNIAQRFRDPAHQPSSIDNLWPRPLSLIGKKLHRCKGCDHILLKADVNLNSIRFKINQLALYTIPRVRVVHMPTLILDQPVIVPVSFTNPVSHPVKLSFEPYPDVKRLKEKICFPLIPEGEFILSDIESIDVVMDDDPTSEGESGEAGNTYILSQEPGKLVLKFGVLAESFDVDSKIAFVVKYSYISTIADDNTEHMLEIPVLLNCGRSMV